MNRKKITIFAVPKPFEGHTGIIQRNAIKSWSLISDEVEILLLGDEPGVKEVADEFALIHDPRMPRNEQGTPLLDSVFRLAHQHSSAPMLMYVNSDIIMTKSILHFIDSIESLNIEQFLAIGMRQDFDQETPIEFNADWEERIKNEAMKNGEYASILCKDYFLFPNMLYREVPAFCIGRGNWDSWMVATASKAKIPVIDATKQVFAGHQNHGYSHTGGRMKAYVSGVEAKENIRLAGGTHYIKGSVPTHRITEAGTLKRINRVRFLSMAWDLPRLLKQLFSFIEFPKSSANKVDS